MSFDIVQTPTLQAVATQDEKQLADHLQKRVDEAISQAEAQPGVGRAITAHGTAADRLKKLQKAERVLNAYAKASREQMTASGPAVLDAIVESAAAGGKPDFKKLDELAALEKQNAYASRAIQRVIEHLIPLAQIALLREESHALTSKARAVERIAQERAEKVLGHLRDAVSEEVVLPVDMSKGVAGALLAYAAGYKLRAVQAAENADQVEKSYCKLREAAREW
jgi:hypothetical protein